MSTFVAQDEAQELCRDATPRNSPVAILNKKVWKVGRNAGLFLFPLSSISIFLRNFENAIYIR